MDKFKQLRKPLGTYECVLMLPSAVNETVPSALSSRLIERLLSNEVPFVRETVWGNLVLSCKGKRQEARWCMHLWFKTNRPEASKETIRNVCRMVKMLKWTFYKTDCYNANVRLQFPIVHFNRKSPS
ncbi:MAG: hypothetical protein ACTS5F_00880 [Candidatus Hodgkinia cicadicola]